MRERSPCIWEAVDNRFDPVTLHHLSTVVDSARLSPFLRSPKFNENRLVCELQLELMYPKHLRHSEQQITLIMSNRVVRQYNYNLKYLHCVAGLKL